MHLKPPAAVAHRLAVVLPRGHFFTGSIQSELVDFMLKSSKAV